MEKRKVRMGFGLHPEELANYKGMMDPGPGKKLSSAEESLIPKHSIAFPFTNPFITEESLNANPEDFSWDWCFEEHAFLTKRRTIAEYDDEVQILVHNRTLAADVTGLVAIHTELLSQNNKSLQVYFVQTFLGRLVKTSKVIQDLVLEGSYAEAKALLRINFERLVQLEYFIKHPEDLEEFSLKGYKREIERKYSAKRLFEAVKRDYVDYKFLCHYVHPNPYHEDIITYDAEGGIVIQLHHYNLFKKSEVLANFDFNNLLLMEAMEVVINYVRLNLPSEQIYEGFAEVMDHLKRVTPFEPSELKENLKFWLRKEENDIQRKQ